ncbi:MAG: hypothetical protein KJ915_00685 [Candidatus Omnitrophica bacterium]|nr:hypothetical protein [Candidatus Omnitrophota bacterium]
MHKRFTILITFLIFYSSLFPAYVLGGSFVSDCLSPAVTVNLENFRVDFSTQMNMPDKAVPKGLSDLLVGGDVWEILRKLGEIERFYNGALDGVVNGEVNRVRRNLIKAQAHCKDLIGLKKLQTGEVIWDKQTEAFFEKIADYEKKITDCKDDIDNGRVTKYKEAWKVQCVDPETGKFLSDGVPINFLEAHQKGIWHASVQVLIVDAEGRILVDHLSDKKNTQLITKSLAASGHLIDQETYPEAIKRVIDNNLGIAVNKGHLHEVAELPYGQRIMGRSDFNGPVYYDDSRIMHVSSRDAVNNEYNRCFIYVLDEQETIEIKNKLIDGRLMGEFMPIASIFERRNQLDTAMYRSSFMRIFNNPDNFEQIINQLQGILIGILRNVSTDPEANHYDAWRISEFAGKVISMRTDFSENKNVKPVKDDEHGPECGRAKALQELHFAASKAKVFYRWQKSKELLQSLERENFLNISEVHRFFKGMKTLGLPAEDRASCALIYLFLRNDVKLIWDVKKKRFLFTHDAKPFEGMHIDFDGKLRITNKQLIKNIKEIQRGVIASDMDLVLAMRDKNVDKDMMGLFNQMWMFGFALAIISGNEFNKQYARLLAELIHQDLLRDVYLYANGAGVKGKFAREKISMTSWGGEVIGSFEEDKKYASSFSPQQLNFFNTRVQAVLSSWERVIEAIRDNRQLLDDTNKHADLAEIIRSRLVTDNDSVNKKIAASLSLLIEDLYAVMHLDNDNPKFKAYQEKVRAQLDPQNSKASLQKQKNWPFVDNRPSLDGKKLIQVTLKPIYPTKKYLTAERDSSREILGKIILELITELNADSLPEDNVSNGYALLKRQEGGDTSIDILRADVDKAKAAKDLVISYHLEKNPELVLAMDDEMAENGVGYPFLTVPGITVVSMEKTKTGKNREYPDQVKTKIKATLLSSQECGIGTEIEATKNIFHLLLDACEREIWTMLTGENKNPEPAIRRVKIELFQRSRPGVILEQATETPLGIFSPLVAADDLLGVSI